MERAHQFAQKAVELEASRAVPERPVQKPPSLPRAKSPQKWAPTGRFLPYSQLKYLYVAIPMYGVWFNGGGN